MLFVQCLYRYPDTYMRARIGLQRGLAGLQRPRILIAVVDIQRPILTIDIPGFDRRNA